MLMIAALAACGKPQVREKPKLSDEQSERLRRGEPGMSEACLELARYGGIAALPQQIFKCDRMTPERHWTGLWRNDFEGSVFCAAPAKQCVETPDATWLDFSISLPPQWKGLSPGGLYAVDFIGRATVYPGHYGHVGGFRQEVVMDRLISMREIEPPPPPPTKAEVVKHMKQCEASGNCIPNWEEINKIKE